MKSRSRAYLRVACNDDEDNIPCRPETFCRPPPRPTVSSLEILPDSYNVDVFDHLVKIVVVGESGVGKTNLLSRFTQGVFRQDERSTIGVDMATKNLRCNGKFVKVQVRKSPPY